MTKLPQFVPAHRPGTPKKATFKPAYKEASTGYTHPTLSAVTATEITATGFKPRVTYTFS
jgi:hypothetical protein